MRKRLKVTASDATHPTAMQVGEESEFARSIEQLVRLVRPLTIIETGTYLGVGTTSAICRGLAALPQIRCEFHTIEVNPRHYTAALVNLAERGYLRLVNPLNGLSLPRSLLPSREAIRRYTVDEPPGEDIFVDFPEESRVDIYFRETEHADCPDDLLDICLRSCGCRPDLLLLDSAGHIGFIEFRHVLDKLRGQCFFALDDTMHVKHHESLVFIRRDPRFTILRESADKFGYCIAKFTPA
ncbi:MAG: hypothetical protein LBT97_08475 [Planctomycetota bacterium]|nr:hypothetical protein [Planctomycetota bacterium]